jgi:hypothetical protein
VVFVVTAFVLSEEEVVLEEFIVAEPATGFVQPLRRFVHDAGAENQPFGARLHRVLPRSLEERSTDAAAPNVGPHEEIVQDPKPLQRD